MIPIALGIIWISLFIVGTLMFAADWESGA